MTVVIGGGVAGLSAALKLAALDIDVTLIEKADRLGGTAVQLSCKATDRCVACGACAVSRKVDSVLRQSNISVCLQHRIKKVEKHNRFFIELEPKKSSAITRIEADAIIAATGFQVFDPVCKPYGYGKFEDVITNLDMERMLREKGCVTRPSDGNPPKSIAFIQCIGSRDDQLNHLWCSRVCCGASLRLANRIKYELPDTDISIFYMDIQGDIRQYKTGDQFLTSFHRFIPGDIIETDNKQLMVSCFENGMEEKRFDMVCLSVGMMPKYDNYYLYKQMGLPLCEDAFSRTYDGERFDLETGVFPAGTVTAPMGIADSISSADQAARDTAVYLKETR